MPRAKLNTCCTIFAPRCAAVFMISRIFSGAFVGTLDGKCFHAHEDRGEDVVQIVRDSSCQRADAFQSLGAEKLPLNRSLLGDVGVHRKDTARFSLRVADKGPRA